MTFDRHPDEAPSALMETARRIRNELRARRLRDQLFDANLFADPAWDILLDLYAATLEQRKISVSSACIASAVPPTTGLRHVKVLTSAGLIVRERDKQDYRRSYLIMTRAALEAMHAYQSATAGWPDANRRAEHLASQPDLTEIRATVARLQELLR